MLKNQNPVHGKIHLREIKDDTDHKNETVGADLRAARLALGHDIDSAAQALKINKNHLRAIEESDHDALPGIAYAIGFIHSYAEFVGLGAPECIRRYKAQLTEVVAPIETAIPRFVDERVARPYAWVVVALVGLGLAMVGWYIAALEWGGDPDTLVSSDANLPDVSDIPLLVREVGETVDPAQLALEATAGSQDTTEVDAGDVSQQIEVVSPQLEESLPQAPDGKIWGEGNDGRLRLKAHADVWLRLESEQAILFERVLNRGEIYQASPGDQYVLTSRDGGAIEVMVDGKTLGRAGETGRPLAGLYLDVNALHSSPADLPGGSEESAAEEP